MKTILYRFEDSSDPAMKAMHRASLGIRILTDRLRVENVNDAWFANVEGLSDEILELAGRIDAITPKSANPREYITKTSMLTDGFVALVDEVDEVCIVKKTTAHEEGLT